MSMPDTDTDDTQTSDDTQTVDDTSPAETPDTSAPDDTEAPESDQEQPAPAAQPQAMPQPTNAQQLKADDQALQYDLNAGHIKPETYSDLFAKKSTLGKIGTFFGMMMSGAGSGLAHQPNALLDMMNREITNDLEAQKASASNKVNLYQIAQKQQLQTAEIKKMQQEGLLSEAQAKHLTVDADIKSMAWARMQANRIAFHNKVLEVSKLPVGSPQRLQGEQTLALMQKAVDNENFDIADRAAASSALVGASLGVQPGSYAGAPQTPQANEAAFQANQQLLRVGGQAPLAESNEAHHIPGIEGQSSVPISGGDRADITNRMMFQRSLQDFIDWTAKHSGDLSPTDRNYGQTLANQLQGAYRAATHGGVYKEGEQHFISSIIDSTPTKFFNDIRVLPQLQAVQKTSRKDFDTTLKNLGFAGYKPPMPPEGTKGKQNGKDVIVSQGQWVPIAKKGKK